MSTLKVGNLQHPDSGNVSILLNSSGSIVANGSMNVVGNLTTTGMIVPSSSYLRNRIINGDMRIDQRNGGALVSSPGAQQYLVDRFAYLASGASKFSAQQNAGGITPPAGFTNYLGFTSSSSYSVTSNDYFSCYQNIEGYNVADFNWGTSNALTVTLSFWVRSSLTGTFGGVIQNSAVNRTYPFTYVISQANTWEYKTVTIPGDTTGTWLKTNGIGFYIQWALGAGSNLSGTAGAWTSSNLVSVTGAVSVVGVSGATWYITGVQLEEGSVATPFERRSYGHELMLCQRYYEKMGIGGTCGAISATGQVLSYTYNYRVPKRSAVTPVYIASTEGNLAFAAGSPTFGNLTTESFLAYKVSNAGNTNANWYVTVYADAEL